MISRARTIWPALGWFKQFVVGDAATESVRDSITLPVMTNPHPGTFQVLVFDDDPLNLMMASDLLSAWGITPQLAADAAQAVELAGALPFDLIPMDLQMPILDGLGATLQTHRRERERASDRAAIVAYTSMSSGESLLQACGIDGVLAKPCDLKA